MKRVLILCTHNSARSQMAEGWLRQQLAQAGVAAEVHSAGSEKTRVKPEAIQVMAEKGIDLAQHSSKLIEELPDSQNFDAVVTVCDDANRTCPLFGGETRRYHVGLPDPSGGSLDDWRTSRDQVERVFAVLASHLQAGTWPTADELQAAR